MSTANPARVLVVDDSAFVRQFLSRIINSEPQLELVGTAVNGRQGVDKALALKPDLITLDIEMPELDGLGALEEIRAKAPRPRPRILMCSTLTERGSEESLKALSLGASDVILKDIDAFGNDPDAPRREITQKLLAIAGTFRRSAPSTLTSSPTAPSASAAGLAHGTAFTGSGSKSVRLGTPEPFKADFRPELVVVGSSTGGPPALEQLLNELPAQFPCPIIIAQHMPPLFTKSVASRLNGLGKIAVEHAEDRVELKRNTVYIIQGGQHGSISRVRTGPLVLTVSDDPPGKLYKPSADVLFETAARSCRANCVGVMLTGMGDDGRLGAAVMHTMGAPIFTQDEESCVVYGMPRAVAEAGLSSGALDPGKLGSFLATLAQRRSAAA